MRSIYLYSAKNKSLLTTHVVEVQDQAFYEETPFNRSFHYWPGIVRVVRRPGFAAVYITANAAHVIPRRAFASDQQVDQFVALVEERIRTAQPTEGLWEVIYADGKVIIPTLARTKGPWIRIEPIDVLDWRDRAELQARIAAKIRSGNPQGKWSKQVTDELSPLAKAAGFSSNRTLEQKARGWAVETIRGVYHISPYKRPARGRGWLGDGDNEVALPADASEEIAAAKVIEVMEAAIRNA